MGFVRTDTGSPALMRLWNCNAPLRQFACRSVANSTPEILGARQHNVRPKYCCLCWVPWVLGAGLQIPVDGALKPKTDPDIRGRAPVVPGIRYC